MINNLLIDFKKITKHFKEQGTWVFIGRIYLMFISFILSIVLTRTLDVDAYGEYKYILSIFALFAFFSLPESSQIMMRYVPRGQDNIYQLLLKLRVKFSILGSLAFVSYALYNYYNNEMGLYYSFLCLSLVFPFFYSYQLFDPFLQAKMNYKLLNKLFVIRSTVQLFLVFFAVILFKTALAGIIAFTLSIALSNWFFYNLVKKKYSIFSSNNVSSTKKKKLFEKQAITLSAIGILPIVAENIDKILIVQYIDYKSLAIFSIGLLIGKTVNGFFKPFLSTINAKLVHKELAKRHYFILFIGGTLLGMILSLVIPKLIIFIYGEQYAKSTIFANVIILSMGIYFLQTVYYNQALFNRNSSINKIYINNVITPIILIILIGLFLHFPNDIEIKLLLLSCLYPIRLLLTIFIIYILRKR